MKSKIKSRSTVLFLVCVAFIFSLAFAGYKGFEIAGWKFKSFDETIAKGLDLQGGISVLMEAESTDVTTEQMQQTKDMLDIRVNKLGVAETVVTIEGDNRIRIDIPGSHSSDDIVDKLKATGNLTFRDEAGTVLLTGKEDVKKAEAGIDQTTNKPIISLELTAGGATKFAEATEANLGKTISIYMDEEVVSAPRVDSVILDGKAQITGSANLEEATQTANIINAGALPIDIKVASITNVGPQLGAEALPNAVKAGAIGLGLIFIFMVAYYRLPGLISSIALTLYITLTLMSFGEADVTLTLPGIAALVLSIGMAVDANVLIFERIREELTLGVSIKSAVARGFENALSSIVDSNVTTIISALVLYYMGTGPVKGFAVTLMMGIVISLFTSLIVTKILINLAVDMGLLSKTSHFKGVKGEAK